MSAAVELIEGEQRAFRTNFRAMPLGRPLGGKAGKVCACPKCGAPSWKKSAREYIHESVTRLQPTNNEPAIERISGCDLTRFESEEVAAGRSVRAK